jgi:hypothetical protein
MGKSQIWCRAQDVPANILPAIRNRNCGVEVCGTPIGFPEFVQQFMQSKVDQYLHLHELTRAIPDLQQQYLLLRFCTNSNLNHWIRTMPPAEMQPFCSQFDAEVLQTLKVLLKASPIRPGADSMSQLEIMQARQHTKWGGLGLMSSESISPAAWVGSWSLTKYLIHKIYYQSDTCPEMNGF